MRTTNTFGVQFIIRPDKVKEGKVPVYTAKERNLGNSGNRIQGSYHQ